MGVIDCHVHLYSPGICASPGQWALTRGERHWATLCARVRKNGSAVQGFPSVEELLRAMDFAGVERAILQGWYWEKHDSCVDQNHFYARCIQTHPDRLSACATFHPAAGREAVRAELDWAKQRGFCGLGELSPHSQAFSVEHPVWRAALEQAATLQFPVLLHVTEPGGRGYPGRVLTPLGDFVRLAEQHPETTFILAHWGARLPLQPAFAAARSLRNVYYDTAASPLLYDFAVFRETAVAIGAERIIFGSDYPLILFPNEEVEPGIASFLIRAKAVGFDPPDERALFGGNARRVFHLS